MTGFCAKCSKAINGHGTSMGTNNSIYGKFHPHLCTECHRKWHDVYDDGYKIIVNLSWKEKFEGWLGYEWKDMEKEKVVFT